MSKGVVMKINHRHATVMTQDCRIIRIKRQPDMKLGQEFNLEKGTIMNQSKRRIFMPAMATAVVLVLLAAGLLLSGVFASPVYATLSVDINPSVEFDLNRNLEVVEARAMNQEAEQLMIRENYIGLGWEAAVVQWAQTLRTQAQFQVENMLISAVMPEGAIQLKEQLVNMEETANIGELKNIAVRVIYSNDEAVKGQAADNSLSLGRQMLLNQSNYLHAGWDSQSIADASLSNLIPTLLRKGERDQTRLTWQTTESMEDPTGTASQSQSGQTSRQTEGSQQQSQQASGETSQATNRETSGSANMSGPGNEAAPGGQTAQSSTICESSQVQATTCEPSTCESSGSKQSSEAD